MPPHYAAFPDFQDATYLDRYQIFCEKLVLERHYTATAFIWTCADGSFGSVEDRISIENFLHSYIAYLKGKKEAYE